MSLNKNSMLPTFQGNYKDMIGAINAGEINSPCWMYLHDRNCLAFIHWEVNDDGEKILVPHVMLWDKLQDVDDRLTVAEQQLEGLKDPTTGEPISVPEYIKPIESSVEDIIENGSTIMIHSLGGDK